MFDKMTERARKVLGFAKSKAFKHRETNQPQVIGTDHMLWALLSERGSANELLEDLDVSVPLILLKLESQFPDKVDSQDDRRSLPFTPRSKKVLDAAHNFMKDRNHSVVGTEHLLIGVALVDSGSGYNALKEALDAAGVSISDLLAAVDKYNKPSPKPISQNDNILDDIQDKEDGDKFIYVDGKLEKLQKLQIKIGHSTLHIDVIEKHAEGFINEFEDMLFRYGITKTNAHG